TVVGSSSRWVGSGDFFDLAVIKYSSAGTALWTNRYNRGGDAHAAAVATSTNGDIFVTGAASTNNAYSYDQQNIVTIKYSATGVALWTNLYKAPGNSWSVARALSLDDSGNVVVAGNSYTTNDQGDFIVIKY